MLQFSGLCQYSCENLLPKILPESFLVASISINTSTLVSGSTHFFVELVLKL